MPRLACGIAGRTLSSPFPRTTAPPAQAPAGMQSALWSDLVGARAHNRRKGGICLNASIDVRRRIGERTDCHPAAISLSPSRRISSILSGSNSEKSIYSPLRILSTALPGTSGLESLSHKKGLSEPFWPAQPYPSIREVASTTEASIASTPFRSLVHREKRVDIALN